MAEAKEIYFDIHTAHYNYERRNPDDVKYIREDLTELTWEQVQDIWFITDKVLRSIPEDPEKWEEWMFNTSGRFTKALDEINRYRQKKK